MAEKQNKLLATSAVAAIVVAIAVFAAYWRFNKKESAGPLQGLVRQRQAWEKRFDNVYVPRESEAARLVPPPYIPERAQWIQEHIPKPASPSGIPDQMVLIWNGQEFGVHSASYGKGGTVASTLRTVVGLSSFSLDIPPEILALPMTGDWVVRADAPQAQLLGTLEGEFAKVIGKPVRLSARPIEREVIVAAGTFKFVPLSDSGVSDPATIHVFQKELDHSDRVASGNLALFLTELATALRRPVIVRDVAPDASTIRWHFDSDVLRREFSGAAPSAATVDEVLGNVSRQTGLLFRREKRVMPQWVLGTPMTQPATQMTTQPATQPTTGKTQQSPQEPW